MDTEPQDVSNAEDGAPDTAEEFYVEPKPPVIEAEQVPDSDDLPDDVKTDEISQ